jgi:phosphatidylserine/phosphatidylglycerophosphate/cardiolipin synthase-like enzyme
VLTGESFFPDEVSVQRDPRHADVTSVSIISSPGSEEHPLRLFFFLTFLAARERLWIASPYFVPDKHTREVIKRRARAGVDVRLLLPNELTDARPIRYASHSYYAELLAAGVRVFEYQPSMMHAKTVVVDGLWAVVGSANMDIRSKELNEENVMGILERDFAVELERSMESSFSWMPPKPPLDMIMTTSPVDVLAGDGATISSTSGMCAAGVPPRSTLPPAVPGAAPCPRRSAPGGTAGKDDLVRPQKAAA